MGLASALSTALTGLTAAETQIDVVGNNLANSQTVGYKASDAVFATQFLRSIGLGSGPSQASGGTNPRQVGLGTQVAAISPNFSQGTIEISANPSDVAIQGDGFFIVDGGSGEQLFTRNGIFKTNAENELVTSTGQRLLGFGVDENFAIQSTELVPLVIPLGSAAVAQPTQNVFLEGIFSPTGDLADTAEVIESVVLGDNSAPRPDVTTVNLNVAEAPDTSGTSLIDTTGGTLTVGDQYEYRFTFQDNTGTESLPNDTALSATVLAGNSAIRIDNIPDSPQPGPPPEYGQVNIYRRQIQPPPAVGSPEAEFRLIGSATQGAASFLDDGTADPSSGQQLDESSVNGNYSYMITFHKEGEKETRPSEILGPQNVINGRVHFTNLPSPPPPPADGSFPAYDKVRIYRNLASDSGTFHLVTTLDPGDNFTDNLADEVIEQNKLIDLDGPRADSSTLLLNVLTRDNFDYEPLFTEGTMTFEGKKGGRTLAGKEFEITDTSSLQDLLDFMEESVGIQKSIADPDNPVPNSVNNIPGETVPLGPGALVTENGQIRFVSNNGVDNALAIGLSSFQIEEPGGSFVTPNMGFVSIQEAKGQSAVADFVAFDSLGIPLNVRLTAVLEERTGTQTHYRWFADSPNNDPLNGTDIAVGTGRVTFDGQGNLINVSNATVQVDRRNVPSVSPLEFELDFSQVSGLAVDTSTLAASRQDGSAAGTLTSFLVGEDGVIRGVFSNGVTRSLGQIRVSRFSNPAGLEQRGQNLYAQGVNAGLPVESNPGSDGLGTIIAGAVELSNTDIGQNLIDLVLATTQYRGNTRVITAAQQLLDELLNLRR